MQSASLKSLRPWSAPPAWNSFEQAVVAAAQGALPPEALERVHAALQHAA
ncbi:MAG: hypothetical protein MZV49_15520 [Rhodopseudomonas palustris]|nr:hypothetical protein [Rhodopseudomonas palustris]